MTLKNKEYLISFFSFVVFSLFAYFSVGYYGGDEHFQLIEFAHFFNGGISEDALAWEYAEQIRPGLQPLIAAFIFKGGKFLGVESPFVMMGALRFLSAIVSFLALLQLYRFTKAKFSENRQHYYLFILMLFWFVPMLVVRFSSEIWAGSFLIIGAIQLMKSEGSWRKVIFSLFLLAFAFQFRYQIVFSIGGLFLWLLVSKSVKPSKWIMYIGVLVIMASATSLLFDSLFYREIVFSPLAYFKVNLIEGVANEFGEKPILYYFFYIFRYPFFLFGGLLLIAFIFMMIKGKTEFAIWLVVPFILGHTFISHKELRFLFPLMFLAPYFLFWIINFLKGRTFFIVFLCLFVLNITGLIVSLFTPMGEGEVNVIAQFSEIDEEVNLYYGQDANVFYPWGIKNNFYKNDLVKAIPLSQEVGDLGDGKNYLVIRGKESENEKVKSLKKGHGLHLIYKGTKDQFYPFLKVYGYPFQDEFLLYEIVNRSKN